MRTVHLTETERPEQVPATGSSPTTAPGRPSHRDLCRAAVTGLSPSVLLIGLVYHPHLDDLRDKGTVAAALIDDTTRWGIAHLVVGMAAALVLLAFLSVDAYLREGGRSALVVALLPLAVLMVTNPSAHSGRR